MNVFTRCGLLAITFNCSTMANACPAPCRTCAPPAVAQATYLAEDSQPSWIFRHSTYSHDPTTGVRVAQYQRIAPVEPLDDERNVTSRYRRIQTNQRGTDGSTDTTYEVQAWGNGRGGLDAEWERFHDAWKESYIQGGNFNQGPGWNGNGWNGPNNGNWNNGNWNGPWNNGNGWNGGGNWGPGNGGGNWGPQPGPPWQNNGGPNGPWQNNNRSGGGPITRGKAWPPRRRHPTPGCRRWRARNGVGLASSWLSRPSASSPPHFISGSTIL